MEIPNSIQSWALGLLTVFAGYLFTSIQDHAKRVTILESKLDTLTDIKNDLKELKEYVHKNVHDQRNRDQNINTLILEIHKHLDKLNAA